MGIWWGKGRTDAESLACWGTLTLHGKSENGLTEDLSGMGVGACMDRGHQYPRVSRGRAWGAAPSSASGHSRFLREENDNPAASRDDKADLKGTRFYVIDLGTEGLGGRR